MQEKDLKEAAEIGPFSPVFSPGSVATVFFGIPIPSKEVVGQSSSPENREKGDEVLGIITNTVLPPTPKGEQADAHTPGNVCETVVLFPKSECIPDAGVHKDEDQAFGDGVM